MELHKRHPKMYNFFQYGPRKMLCPPKLMARVSDQFLRLSNLTLGFSNPHIKSPKPQISTLGKFLG